MRGDAKAVGDRGRVRAPTQQLRDPGANLGAKRLREPDLQGGGTDGQRPLVVARQCVPARESPAIDRWRRSKLLGVRARQPAVVQEIEAAARAAGVQRRRSSSLHLTLVHAHHAAGGPRGRARIGVELGRVRPEAGPGVLWPRRSRFSWYCDMALAKYADSRGVYRAYMPLRRILSCGDIDRYPTTAGGGALVRLLRPRRDLRLLALHPARRLHPAAGGAAHQHHRGWSSSRLALAPAQKRRPLGTRIRRFSCLSSMQESATLLLEGVVTS